MAVAGDFSVAGFVDANVKQFKITHPLDDKQNFVGELLGGSFNEYLYTIKPYAEVNYSYYVKIILTEK